MDPAEIVICDFGVGRYGETQRYPRASRLARTHMYNVPSGFVMFDIAASGGPSRPSMSATRARGGGFV
jgi:hypothetical protein